MNNTPRTLTSSARAAKEIRDELRAAGVPARAVSVRSDNFSMGSSVNVEIKSLDVSYAVVEAGASKHDRVSRDGFGEILGGGNMYVTVRVDDDAINAAAALVEAMPENARSFMGRRIVPVSGGSHWSDRFHVPGINTHMRLETIACAVLAIFKAGAYVPANLADRICDLADAA